MCFEYALKIFLILGKLEEQQLIKIFVSRETISLLPENNNLIPIDLIASLDLFNKAKKIKEGMK